MDNFDKAFKFAKRSIWQDDTPDEKVFWAAKKAFSKLKKNCTRGKRLMWLTGQSGTGKTSQLLAASQRFCDKHKILPLHMAVRNFAELHPDAQNLKSQPQFREVTNGFALKVLICVLKYAFEEGLDILLEICFLDKSFERFVIDSAIKNGYKISLQIMAVGRTISDALVFKRAKQTGRLTFASSTAYFYKTMESGLRWIAKRCDLRCTLWSAFDRFPIYTGPVKFALSPFKRYRKLSRPLLLNEERLLAAKCASLEELYLDELF